MNNQDSQLIRAKNTWFKLAVPYVKQANNYYCGPATTLQTQKYFNSKTTSTQSSLAKSLGTTKQGSAYSKIKSVLNSRSYIKDKYAFLKVNGKNSLTIGNYIGYAVQIRKPVILNIAIKSTNKVSKEAIGYESKGHFLNASGVKGNSSHYGIADVSHVEYTDPYNSYGKKKNSKGKIEVSIGVNKTVIDNQPSANKNILW